MLVRAPFSVSSAPLVNRSMSSCGLKPCRNRSLDPEWLAQVLVS